MVLTATRSGEVHGAVWNEFDLGTQTWTIPASRMKAARERRVPLSDMALGVLSNAEFKYGGSGLVFPPSTGRPLSDSTMSKLLRELGVKAVPHGFRSSFRDWCAENGKPREIAEAALAHTVKGVESAYFRSDMFEQRREIMQAWSTYFYERLIPISGEDAARAHLASSRPYSSSKYLGNPLYFRFNGPQSRNFPRRIDRRS